MKYYAIPYGIKIGVFDKWDDVKENVNYPGFYFKTFQTYEAAKKFLEVNNERLPQDIIGVYGTVQFYAESYYNEANGTGSYGLLMINPNETSREYYGLADFPDCNIQSVCLYPIYAALNLSQCNLKIYTKSKVAIKCLTEWAEKWAKDDWKDVRNADVIRVCLTLMEGRSVLVDHSKNEDKSKKAIELAMKGASIKDSNNNK